MCRLGGKAIHKRGQRNITKIGWVEEFVRSYCSCYNGAVDPVRKEKSYETALAVVVSMHCFLYSGMWIVVGGRPGSHRRNGRRTDTAQGVTRGNKNASF